MVIKIIKWFKSWFSKEKRVNEDVLDVSKKRIEEIKEAKEYISKHEAEFNKRNEYLEHHCTWHSTCRDDSPPEKCRWKTESSFPHLKK